jgi:hypothetical protein
MIAVLFGVEAIILKLLIVMFALLGRIQYCSPVAEPQFVILYPLPLKSTLAAFMVKHEPPPASMLAV